MSDEDSGGGSSSSSSSFAAAAEPVKVNTSGPIFNAQQMEMGDIPSPEQGGSTGIDVVVDKLFSYTPKIPGLGTPILNTPISPVDTIESIAEEGIPALLGQAWGSAVGVVTGLLNAPFTPPPQKQEQPKGMPAAKPRNR